MELIPKRPSAKALADRFTGDVWVDEITPEDVGLHTRVAAVHFAPGARTAWHVHALGRPCTSQRASDTSNLAGAS